MSKHNKTVGEIAKELTVASPQATIDQMGQEAMADGIYEKVPQATRPECDYPSGCHCDDPNCPYPTRAAQPAAGTTPRHRCNECSYLDCLTKACPCECHRLQPEADKEKTSDEIWKEAQKEAQTTAPEGMGAKKYRRSEGTTPQAERLHQLQRQVEICELNHSRWIQVEVADIRKLLEARAVAPVETPQ